jgi:hypothetical protein
VQFSPSLDTGLACNRKVNLQTGQGEMARKILFIGHLMLVAKTGKTLFLG